MSDVFQWPALLGGERHLDAPMQCRLGIWGKVHGQASDYRWIARSDGFGEGHKDLGRALRIGSEDQPISACAWRAMVDTVHAPGRRCYFAIGTYPSRAIDALGRQAGLEKLIFEWQSASNGPPASLAALALLPQLEDADDQLWWDRVDEGDWQRADYALPLDVSACPAAVSLDAAALAAQIEQGIATLAEALGIERLARIYAQLLVGVHPVMIRAQARPLSPAALAALLLPLPPERAERLSLTAWVPSTLVDAADVGKNWDLAVTARPGVEPSVDQADLAEGARLAEALLERAPERLASTRPLAEAARGSEPAADLIDVDALAPEPDRAPEGGWSLHPNPCMGLVPAPADQPPALAYLHEFADRINLRRLDLNRLRAALKGQPRLFATGADPALHPLVIYIQALESAVPSGVNRVEWRFKIDQLRSAALVLLPSPTTLEVVGLPAGEQTRVPALLAVLALDPQQADAGLAAHGIAALRKMLRQGRHCRNPPLVEEIRRWTSDWCAKQTDADLRVGLRDLLAPSARS